MPLFAFELFQKIDVQKHILFRHQPKSVLGCTGESAAQEPASCADRVLAIRKEKEKQEVCIKLYTNPFVNKM